MAYIKFSHSLADIPNPHQLLLVAENHTAFGQILYQIESVGAMRQAGYQQHFIEQPKELKPFDDNMKDILRANPILPQLVAQRPALAMQLAHRYEMQNAGIDYVYSDTADLMNARHADLQMKIQSMLQQIDMNLMQSMNKAFGILPQDDYALMNEMMNAARYASFGPRSFEKFQSTSSLTTDQKEIALKLGPEFTASYRQKARLLDEESVLYNRRNRHIANVIAQECVDAPHTRKSGTYGANHITCGAGKTWEYTELLPDILRNQHHIESTCVILTDPEKIQQAAYTIGSQGIQSNFLDLQETLPVCAIALNVSPIDAYFAITGKSVTEGIHRLGSDAGVVNMDYAVVLPIISNETALENAVPKIKNALNLK